MNNPTMNNPTLCATITYTQREIHGFSNRGYPIYVDVEHTYTIYACCDAELQLRIKQFTNSVPFMSTYHWHRHRKTYYEVI